MFGNAPRGISVVVSELPLRVTGDLPLASWAGEDLATLDSAGKLAAPAVVLGAVQLALAFVACQPASGTFLDRSRSGRIP
jgi:hypothetical protein